jgi:hypothetical protein
MDKIAAEDMDADWTITVYVRTVSLITSKAWQFHHSKCEPAAIKCN